MLECNSLKWAALWRNCLLIRGHSTYIFSINVNVKLIENVLHKIHKHLMSWISIVKGYSFSRFWVSEARNKSPSSWLLMIPWLSVAKSADPMTISSFHYHAQIVYTFGHIFWCQLTFHQAIPNTVFSGFPYLFSSEYFCSTYICRKSYNTSIWFLISIQVLARQIPISMECSSSIAIYLFVISSILASFRC